MPPSRISAAEGPSHGPETGPASVRRSTAEAASGSLAGDTIAFNGNLTVHADD